MTTYPAAIESSRQLNIKLAFEIEGVPTAYGNFSLADASAWYSRGTPRLAEKDRPSKAVSCLLVESDKVTTPLLSASSLDFLGGRSDISTLEIALVDMDGSLAELTALRRKMSCWLWVDVEDLDAEEIVVHGDDASTLADGDLLYIGRETLQITDAPTLNADGTYTVPVERGALQSRASPHFGKFAADGTDHGGAEGDMVSTFPRHLIGRRVVLRAGFNANGDDDCYSVFTGAIRSFAWGNYGSVLKLSCEDFQAQLKRPLFTDIATLWQSDQPNGDPKQINMQGYPGSLIGQTYGAVRINDAPDGVVDSIATGSRLLFVRGSGNDPEHPDAAEGVVILEKQGSALLPYGVPPFTFKIWEADSVAAWVSRPKAYSITPDEHGGLPVRPLILVGKGARDEDGSDVTGGFLWPEDDVNDIQTDHVLAIMLLVLTSSGTPGTNGDWDKLPQKSWGLNVSPDEIDVTSIEAMAKSRPNDRARVPVLEPVEDAREWLIKLLRPYGYMMIVKANGQLGVTSVQEPTPDVIGQAQTLNFDHIALSRGQPIKLEGPSSDGDFLVTQLKWTDSPVLKDGKIEPRNTAVHAATEDLDALATAGEVTSTEIEAIGLYSRDDGISTSGQSFTGYPVFLPPKDAPKGLAVAAELLRSLQLRFAGTPSIYSVETTIRKALVSLGDWLNVTLRLPNPFNGQRGLTDVKAQVIRRRFNLLRGTVELDFSITDAGNTVGRYLAPALRVTGGDSAWNDGTKTLTVMEHKFTDSGGSYYDTSPMQTDADQGAGNGMLVRVYSNDCLYRSQAVRLISKANGAVVLSATPALKSRLDGSDRPGTTDPISGDRVRMADWGEQTNTRAKNVFTYFTNKDGVLSDGQTRVVFAS